MIEFTVPSPEDIPEMVTLGEEFWVQTSYYKEGIDYNPENCKLLAEALIMDGIVVVAKDGDRIIGMILMQEMPMILNPKARTVNEVAFYVKPEYRKAGVGAGILVHAEHLAQEKGIKLINMISLNSVDPTKPQSIYETMGYSLSETIFTKQLKEVA